MPTLIGKVSALNLVYNTATMAYEAWDGSLRVGSVVIGAVTQSGTWNINAVTSITNTVAVSGPLTDAQLRASAVPVSIAATVTTKEVRAASSSVTSVNDSASNQTLLASNANRLGATVHNDSTVALYLKLGATASTSSFTVKMAADSYYEVPYGYTGQIDGVWSSDASGAARITELTA